MSENNRRKVDLEQLIISLIKEVEAIDGDALLTRSKKTGMHARAAQKFKKRLFEDQRRKPEDKIVESTYRRYLSQARRAITKKNWFHHSLEKEVEILSRRYPSIAEELKKLLEIKDISQLRIAHRNLCQSINDSEMHDDIRKMKLDHEVMRHLTLPGKTKENLQEQAAEALNEKKRSTIRINYSEIIDCINDLLTIKTKTGENGLSFSYSRLALGLGLATGRRAIEILAQGEFEHVSEHVIRFSGQAKKRGGADYSKKYNIYTLVNSNLVISSFKNLRELPEIQALKAFDDLDDVDRNHKIKLRCGKTLNNTAKSVFGNEDRVFKDSRAIWARIVYDQYFNSDPRWQKVDEDIFWQEMLGHDDLETQKSYKQFKINYDCDPQEAKDEPVETRYEALEALDDHPAINSRKSLIRLHDWVKEQVNSDSCVHINQTMITHQFGSSRKVIKDYLEIAQDALNVHDPVGKSSVKEIHSITKTTKTPKITITKTEDKDITEKKESAKPKKNVEKPRFKAITLPNGKVEVIAKYGSTEITIVSDESRINAIKKAYGLITGFHEN